MQKVKGTQDILPGESEIWQSIEQVLQDICRIYHFKEIRLPSIEYTEIFTRSIGEETDIVTKEMYSFTSGGGKSITLRPEGTAGIARCYSENKIYGKESVSRWYYIGPMFRAERPQKGRQRQFHQFGIELIGSDSPYSDAEIILLNMDVFRKLGLKNLKLRINSVGNAHCRPQYVSALQDYFKDKTEKLCEQCKIRFEKNILRMLDCKNPSCQEVLNSAPGIIEYLDEDSRQHFNRVIASLSGIDYTVDNRLVRGLDYYTRTVFEITSSDLGGQDALAGGGRYDNLIQAFSGKSIPAVGSAIGLERLIIALTASGNLPEIKECCDFYIAYFEDKQALRAFETQKSLRSQGYSVRMNEGNKKIGNQLKEADRLGARFAVVIGDEELESGLFTLKNLKTGVQNTSVDMNFIIEAINNAPV